MYVWIFSYFLIIILSYIVYDMMHIIFLKLKNQYKVIKIKYLFFYNIIIYIKEINKKELKYSINIDDLILWKEKLSLIITM